MKDNIPVIREYLLRYPDTIARERTRMADAVTAVFRGPVFKIREPEVPVFMEELQARLLENDLIIIKKRGQSSLVRKKQERALDDFVFRQRRQLVGYLTRHA